MYDIEDMIANNFNFLTSAKDTAPGERDESESSIRPEIQETHSAIGTELKSK